MITFKKREIIFNVPIPLWVAIKIRIAGIRNLIKPFRIYLVFRGENYSLTQYVGMWEDQMKAREACLDENYFVLIAQKNGYEETEINEQNAYYPKRVNKNKT